METVLIIACTRRTITGKTPDDLIRAIYNAEGWTRVEGESRVARCKRLYIFSTDHRRGRYVATPIDGGA